MPTPTKPVAAGPTPEELDELGAPSGVEDTEDTDENLAPPPSAGSDEDETPPPPAGEDNELEDVSVADLANMDVEDLTAIAEASGIKLPEEATTSEAILAVITEAASPPEGKKKDPPPVIPAAASPEITALTLQVQQLTNLFAAQQKAPAAPAAPPKPATQDYIGDLDVTDLSKEQLNVLFNKIAAEATQASLTQVPGVAASMAQQEIQQNILIESYFSANPALNTAIGRQTVGQTMNTLISRNPALTTAQALEQAGKEVIKAFGLTNAPKPKVKPGRGSGRKVNSHGSGGKGIRLQQPKKKTTQLQDELDELTTPSPV